MIRYCIFGRRRLDEEPALNKCSASEISTCTYTATLKNNQRRQRMPRGGARAGAGRKAGVPNKASQKRQAEAARTGELPLAYMLRIMRDEAAPQKRRDEMAKAAALYVHPRLSSVETK